MYNMLYIKTWEDIYTMFAVITSSCIKKSKKKTKMILDQYATRLSNNTWQTPITADGLKHIHSSLKQTASRNTSVQCYINDGKTRLKLLWSVGKCKGPHYHTAYINDLVNYRTSITPTIRMLTLIAKASGYAHDLGKATTSFQNKLKAGIQGGRALDPFRHEWVSMCVLQHLRALHNKNILTKENAFVDWSKVVHASYPRFLVDGLKNITDVVDYNVATHHKLIGDSGYKAVRQSTASHIYDVKDFDKSLLNVSSDISYNIITNIFNIEDRLKKIDITQHPLLMELAATITRPMLIMADHVISGSDKYKKDLGVIQDTIYANTAHWDVNDDAHPIKHTYKQTLSEHLQWVGDLASFYTFKLLTDFKLPVVSEDTIGNILQESTAQLFKWQDIAVNDIYSKRSEHGMLLFNIADTGTGKTLANLKLLTSLREKACRVTVALNLRTLTLQTGDAFKSMVHPKQGEVITIIGDSVSQQLYDSNKEDDDNNEVEYNTDIYSCDGDISYDIELPEWLQAFTKKQKSNRREILQAPILVSTIDYIIQGANPDKQGNHVMGFLRTISSDLIFDEIDMYEPKALSNVCRLVELAAIFGRNIVCSSATLSVPVADIIYKAYSRGVQMRELLLNITHTPIIALVAHNTINKIESIDSVKHFSTLYNKFIHDKCNIKTPYTKLAMYADISIESKTAYYNSIVPYIIQLHTNNHIEYVNKNISFGLVRFGNIKTVIEFANYISSNITDTEYETHIVAYHSNDTVINRYYKETILDEVLTRKNKTCDNLKSVDHIIQKSVAKNIIFLAITSPVEEVGRDHDFDWAVIEPSSIQSIIQTSGRVNRHRLLNVTHPNICILSHNIRSCTNNKRVFYYPGYELDDIYEHHDVAQLLPWSNNMELQITASLRFPSITGEYVCRFAEYDDNTIRSQLCDIQNIFFNNKRTKQYDRKIFSKDYIFRDIDNTIQYQWCDNEYKRIEYSNKKLTQVSTNAVLVVNPVPNSWLNLQYNDSVKLCKSKNISVSQGLVFNVTDHSSENEVAKYFHHLSYGVIKI
jgi:CRISPR-associated endonuclease/helicase Cas3